MQMLSYHSPLKERIIGKDTQTKKPSSHFEADCPLRYKSCNAENMMRAIEAVQKNECTNREASEIYQARSHWLGWSGFNLATFITIHTTLI